MRLAVYGATSTVLGAGVILSAFNQRANFYSACVHLGQSNACLMVLTNLLLLLSILLGHGLQLVFYGPLRAPEIERLYEKAWYAVTETCLAMTIFRDEFDVRFIVMFGVLLFVKCFSWIGGGRVEFMETQPPANPTLFHIRLASSLILLLSACGAMLWHSVLSVLEQGRPNMMVMFAFEFAILLITSLGITGRYVLNVVEKFILKQEAARRREARVIEREANRNRRSERRAENQRRRDSGETVEDDVEPEEDDDEDDDDIDVGGWEEKGTWVFYLELTTDLLKLATYLCFFAIVLTWYGLPLHIIRDVYLTLRSFITRIRDFIRYRRATAHMNSRYPDATAEEVEREGVCIICREEMRAWTAGAENEGGRAAGTQDQRSRPKRLPCGHVLHFSCLRSWLERQQRCPTCRRPVLDEPTPTGLGGNNAANPGAPGQPGLNFQAGGDGLGFRAEIAFGVGGPGLVQNLIDRMNAPAVQQGNQNVQGPQEQNEDLARATMRTGNIRTEIDQHIARTRQLLDRELAMIDITQRQLRQLQELQAHAQMAAGGAQVALDATARAGNPVTPAPPEAGTQQTPSNQSTNTTTPADQSTPTTAPTISHPVPSGNPSLPAGMTLPSGWSVIPLAVPGADHVTNAHNTANNGGVRLSRRREQRTYQEWMRAYHARMTPSTERTEREAELMPLRPSISRAVTAPSDLSLPITISRTTISLPTVPQDASSRLTSTQIANLRPSVQESVAIISHFVQYHVNEDRPRLALEILCGLPEQFRQYILDGWPDREMAQILSTSGDNLPPPSNGRHNLAAYHVSVLAMQFSFERKVRLLLGIPKSSFRNSLIRYFQDPHIDAELEKLDSALSDLGQPLPNVSSLLESISDWTEIPSLSETSDKAATERAEKETREIANKRIEVLNDISRAMRTAANRLEQVHPSSERILGQFNPDNELSLFGQRSIFDSAAQSRVLESFEADIVAEERSWLEKQRAVDALLSTAGGSSSVTHGKGKGKATVEDAEE
ncbi:hypothetical protein L873DRAFT_679847 [Choiromyces venosus 120613-1]|uniref:RING-type E3 ubiquitin transferase n=1 Tax=Choiromyces venosus 120613-1 TaxID=1336337 RepID=A0A3N4K631_9PEZI|nr:hypothetical protein L873DRAFT_679847 [Choiromyces venosus 120613-1]